MQEPNDSGNVRLERQVRREPFELTVTRYRDPEGKPTCCADFSAGDSCVFLRVSGICGKVETCGYCCERLNRRFENGRYTYLEPAGECPLWK